MAFNRQLSAALWVALLAGLALFASGCDLVTTSNASPPDPLVPTSVRRAPETVVPTSTPAPHPATDTDVQQRLAEILTPAPGSKVGPGAPSQPGPTPEPELPAGGPPAAAPVQPPTATPVDSFQPRYYRSGFACTGSMRPAIDCGDEGVFLEPPFQEPLQVGDVISFAPKESCRHYKNHNVSKAHRIVSIRVEEETSYYTTKGDSALTPDDCEVTMEQIDGKLVEVNKGARPQDIIDTGEYDLAKERVRRLKEQYRVKRAEYDRRKGEYEAHGKEYEELVAAYEVRRTGYQEVQQFQQDLEEERVALNGLRDEVNSLGKEINSAIDEVDRLYRELFMSSRN